MSFYDSASLAFLPSGGAGKDGKAYSIKPVPEYGNELITNGGFYTDSDWIKGAGWTISGGTANFTGSAYGDGISNSNVTTLNKVYAFSCDIISGSFDVKVGSTSYFSYSGGTIYVTANNASSNAVIIRPLSSSVVIDNVSVREVIVDGDFTFSRGSNLTATRVNSSGLIEKGRENLLTQSNNFSSNPPWGSTSISFTSGENGYDGSSDAWIIERTDVNAHIRQTPPLGNVMTFSIYAKANTLNWVRIRTGSVQNAYFDLGTGSIGTTQNIIDATITDIGNGWYRCTATAIGYDRFYIYPAVDNNDVSGTSGSIYIQDAQAEIGLTSTEYIESGATTGKAGILEDSPRFDYSGGASCPSLLLEPSRTNLSSSEYFEQFWSTSSGGTRVYNQITSPEGIQNGTKIYPTSTGSFRGLSKAFGSTLSNTPYALSIFAKAGEFEHLYFYNVGSPNGNNGVWFNLTTGSVGTNQNAWTSAKIEDFGNGWYRCSAVITTGGTSDNLYILLSDSNGSVTATTSGTDGLYIYGAQLEEGSYPTSYIPNHSGGSVTRLADILFEGASLLNNFFNPTEGTLFFEVDEPLFRQLTSDGRSIALRDSTNGEYFQLRGRSNSVYFLLTMCSPNVVSIANIENNTKYAIKWNGSEVKMFTDGAARGSSTQIDSFRPYTLGVATGFGMYTPIGEKFNNITFFPTALSNTDCEILTGTSYESFAAMATALNYTTYE